MPRPTPRRRPPRGASDECPRACRPRARPRHERGQGRARVARRATPRARACQLPDRPDRRSRLGGAGSGCLVVGRRECGPCAPRPGTRRDRRDRRGRPRPDARGGRRAWRGDPPGRSPGSTRARPARRPSWPPRPASAAGPSAGCRPRSGSSATNPRSPRRRTGTSRTWEWLAFRLAGVAVAPLIPDQLVPDPAVVRRHGRAGPQAATDRGDRHGRRRADRDRRRRVRAAARHPGRRRDRRCLRELSRRRSPRAG